MGIFSALPIRRNGQKILAAWFNTLRDKLLLLEASHNTLSATVQSLTGGGGTSSDSAIGNGQTEQNIVGLVLNPAYTKHTIEYVIKRTSSTGGTVRQSGCFSALFDGTTWSFVEIYKGGEANVAININDVTGQFVYTSDTMSGVYDAANSKMIWSIATQG